MGVLCNFCVYKLPPKYKAEAPEPRRAPLTLGVRVRAVQSDQVAIEFYLLIKH